MSHRWGSTPRLTDWPSVSMWLWLGKWLHTVEGSTPSETEDTTNSNSNRRRSIDHSRNFCPHWPKDDGDKPGSIGILWGNHSGRTTLRREQWDWLESSHHEKWAAERKVRPNTDVTSTAFGKKKWRNGTNSLKGGSNVAYRPVAKRLLCKQRPLLGNARNIYAPNNMRTVFPVVRTAAIAMQRRSKHMSTAKSPCATMEELCFLCGPWWDVISTRHSSGEFSTGCCEERTWAREAEESPLLEVVARERPVKTAGFKRLSVCCGDLWIAEISGGAVIACSSKSCA
jgi:hypothetical protein